MSARTQAPCINSEAGITTLSKITRPFCAVLVLLYVGFLVYQAPINMITRSDASQFWANQVWNDDSHDSIHILHMVQNIHSFEEAQSFWDCTNYAGTQYWRPLTEITYWTQWDLYGFHFERYGAVSVILYYLCTIALGWTIWSMSRRFDITLLTLFLFAGFRPFFNLLYPTFDTPTSIPALSVMNWKDQPDLWTDIFVFLSIGFAFQKHWTFSLISAIVAVCFKETGWFAFMLIPGFYYSLGKWNEIPKYIKRRAICSTVLLILIRIHAHYWGNGFHGTEFYEGHANPTGFLRYIINSGGIIINNLFLRPGAVVLALGLIYSFWNQKQTKKIYPFIWKIALTILATIATQMIYFELSFLVALASLFDWSTLGAYTMGCLLFFLSFACLCRNEKLHKMGFLAIGTALFCAIPYGLRPWNELHLLHQAYAWQAFFVSLLIVALIERVSNAKSGDRESRLQDQKARADQGTRLFTSC
ncbi:MAG: hypothetical protein P4L33_08440 [Capsulimonadaceae bacterium]|nr:hypothetical protein [Capsulimonadaceae bacterium]